MRIIALLFAFFTIVSFQNCAETGQDSFSSSNNAFGGDLCDITERHVTEVRVHLVGHGVGLDQLIFDNSLTSQVVYGGLSPHSYSSLGISNPGPTSSQSISTNTHPEVLDITLLDAVVKKRLGKHKSRLDYKVTDLGDFKYDSKIIMSVAYAADEPPANIGSMIFKINGQNGNSWSFDTDSRPELETTKDTSDHCLQLVHKHIYNYEVLDFENISENTPISTPGGDSG